MLLSLSLLKSSGADTSREIWFSFPHIQLKMELLYAHCYRTTPLRTRTTRSGSVCCLFRLDCLYQCEAVAVTGHEYRRNKKKIKEEARGKYFKQLATSSQQDLLLKTKQECVFIKQGLIVSQLLPAMYHALFKDACLISLFLASLFFFSLQLFCLQEKH